MENKKFLYILRNNLKTFLKGNELLMALKDTEKLATEKGIDEDGKTLYEAIGDPSAYAYTMSSGTNHERIGRKIMSGLHLCRLLFIPMLGLLFMIYGAFFIHQYVILATFMVVLMNVVVFYALKGDFMVTSLMIERTADASRAVVLANKRHLIYIAAFCGLLIFETKIMPSMDFSWEWLRVSLYAYMAFIAIDTLWTLVSLYTSSSLKLPVFSLNIMFLSFIGTFINYTYVTSSGTTLGYTFLYSLIPSVLGLFSYLYAIKLVKNLIKRSEEKQ